MNTSMHSRPRLAQPLKTIRHTQTGELFDLTSDLWGPFSSGGRHIYLDFKVVVDVCAPGLAMAAKESTADLLEAMAPGTVGAVLRALKRILCFAKESSSFSLPLSEISGDLVEGFFLDRILPSDHRLKALFTPWRRWRRPGLTESAWDAIKDRSFQNSVDQTHILTLDPQKGPYLDSEIQAMDQALLHAYETGEICDERFLIAMTFRLFGQRPVTNAALKCGDVETPKHDGAPQVGIRFPINKKHHQKVAQGPLRPVPMLYGRVMEQYLDRRFQEVLDSDRANLPLFPMNSPTWTNWGGKRGTGQTEEGYRGHCKTSALAWRFQRVMSDLKIISPRTTQVLTINATRERHTVGTLLAMQGCNAEAIAAWLEHDSPESCEAYVELGVRHHQLMHSLLDGKFLHVAGRFLGEVIKSDSLRGFEGRTLITDHESPEMQEMGGCASGGCTAVESLAAPYACFLCPSFRLSSSAILRPLIERVALRMKQADELGNSEYKVTLSRHLAALMAAQRALGDIC